MARKMKAPKVADKSAFSEEQQLMAEVRGEIAQEAYDAQDAKTKAAIDAVAHRLAKDAASTDIYTQHNLLFVAVEIVKDLAVTGIRVASYNFPEGQCVSCGGAL